MNTIEQLKKDITQFIWVEAKDFPNYSERTFRRAISELRKDGIIFISSSIGKGIYISIDGATENEVKTYYHAQERHFKTQYHNSLLPVKKWLKRHNNAKLMGRLETL